MEELKEFAHSPRKVLGSKTVKKIWDKCDDVMSENMMLSDIYDNVPDDVDCAVNVFTIHSFPDDKRDKVIKWLDRAVL